MPPPVLTRRTALAAGLGLAATPALAQDGRPLGPPQGRRRGPLVFRDYDQDACQPHTARVNDRLAMRSDETRGSCFHQDMRDSFGNPYGVNGRAALALLGLASP